MDKFNTFSNVSEGKEFKFINGNVAKNVTQLYKNIKEIPRKDFIAHCNDKKNEFYNWIFDEVKDIELAKEILGCTEKKEVIDAMQTYFTTITKPEPKILKKEQKRPESIYNKKELIQPLPDGLLSQALNLKREKKTKSAEIVRREELLKNLKEVYNIGR